MHVPHVGFPQKNVSGIWGVLVLNFVLIHAHLDSYSHGIINRPQRSWGKVMFLQVSVILLTGGVCLSACSGIPHPTPWSRHPSLEQTPPGSRQPPGSRHPPWEQTPWSRTPPPPPPERAGRYSQRAGGTHPTGMQSCYGNVHTCLIQDSQN